MELQTTKIINKITKNSFEIDCSTDSRYIPRQKVGKGKVTNLFTLRCGTRIIKNPKYTKKRKNRKIRVTKPLKAKCLGCFTFLFLN